jgi:hypothetical protein
MPTFTIYDKFHAEIHGEFATLDDAVSELQRRAEIPWDQEPNCAPCTGWASCGRAYEVIEYETHGSERQVRRMKALEISKEGIVWHEPFGPAMA